MYVIFSRKTFQLLFFCLFTFFSNIFLFKLQSDEQRTKKVLRHWAGTFLARTFYIMA